jgi:hypothetical protein
MKNMFLILSIFFMTTRCSEEETKQQENLIYGNWKLTSFVNQSTNNTLVESDFSDSNQITINFKYNKSFAGSTIRNSFLGNYSTEMNKNKLNFTNLSTTKVNETEWGNLFYNSLNMGYNQQDTNWEFTYEIQNNTLKIYYDNQEYMTFEKL